jgi:hypothetical protein
MSKKPSVHCGSCPECGHISTEVKGYKTRKILHYRVGGMETLCFPSTEFRCVSSECARKTFTQIEEISGQEEVVGRSRYTQSSKKFVAHKLLKKQTSYNSFCAEIKEDFGGNTAFSTLHRWTSEMKVEDVPIGAEPVLVVHTDEKHPSKKKRKSDKKFVIASAGRSSKTGKSRALHANLADSNGIDALTEHYKELIDKGLDADKVEMVVTDMLPAYNSVIEEIFPNATHQYCIFHFIQSVNVFFKTALQVHRTATFEAGSRKDAHKTSFLLLKGQELLTLEEQEIVRIFIEEHPTVAADYALKEDIRCLYASVQTPVQAYAYLDIIQDLYTNTISESMQKALAFLENNFEKTISFLHKGYFLDRTNNDAERMMRQIKRTQQTHYFLRKEENYIKKIKVVLGVQIPIAA